MARAKSKPMLDGQLMFPSKYLAAEEFKGKVVTLTIRDIKQESLPMQNGDSEQRIVLYFTETKKMLVLNKTNAKSIAGLHGSEARGWVGKQVTLYPTTCQAFGDTVTCIRVKDRVESRRSASATNKPADDSGQFDASEVIDGEGE